MDQVLTQTPLQARIPGGGSPRSERWGVDSEYGQLRDVLLGERLASRLNEKPGDDIALAGRKLRISGILSTGGTEDDEVVAPLGVGAIPISDPLF